MTLLLTRIVPAASALLLTAAAAHAATPTHETWRHALARATLPPDGCFKANYPVAAWTAVPCAAAPHTPYIPRTGTGTGRAATNSVGNGADYAASATTLISQGVGSFPSITGLTSEKGAGRSNSYSIQLNANFFSTPVCNGATNPGSCLGWQQFVYSNSGDAFMQYWLIDYGSRCPSGWTKYAPDCYRNSKSVRVPVQALNKLADIAITGSAAASGTDKMLLTTASSAYTTTGKDSVVQLAQGWMQSEFNVVGDGNGSQAVFNTGTTITVKIALTDGGTTAPTCASNAGTTGETNNLNLGACSGTGGVPSISFTEAN